MRTPRNSLLGQTAAAVQQIAMAGTRDAVGVSGVTFNVRDRAYTYQYCAFGVRAGSNGLEEDLVIAPYATALAAMYDRPQPWKFAGDRSPVRVAAGCYESIDYTRTRLSRPAARPWCGPGSLTIGACPSGINQRRRMASPASHHGTRSRSQCCCRNAPARNSRAACRCKVFTPRR
jgi:hypothetical protein